MVLCGRGRLAYCRGRPATSKLGYLVDGLRYNSVVKQIYNQGALPLTLKEASVQPQEFNCESGTVSECSVVFRFC